MRVTFPPRPGQVPVGVCDDCDRADNRPDPRFKRRDAPGAVDESVRLRR